MSDLLPALTSAFEERFGADPQHVVKAPGRVNLIGEHTDYNQGFVMPCAVEYHTLVAIAASDDPVVETLAVDWSGQADSFSLAGDTQFHQTQMWSNYIRGVVSEMKRRGHSLVGCNIAVSGNVPQGAGLSSSAALEVGVIRAIAEISGLMLDLAEIADIGKVAENNFVGCACGIMDQLISACGKDGYAMAIDCRSLELTPLAIPPSLSLLIVNSNVKRGLVDSEYNLRRQQCEEAAANFSKASLRDVSLEEFFVGQASLDPVVAKRAQHVLEENQRVLDLQDAFGRRDVKAISRLMAESHRSMRDLFETTTPEIDLLVDIISGCIGEQGGVRMTGGGFGGCVVSLLPESFLCEVTNMISETYFRATGLHASIYLTRPADGVTVLY